MCGARILKNREKETIAWMILKYSSLQFLEKSLKRTAKIINECNHLSFVALVFCSFFLDFEPVCILLYTALSNRLALLCLQLGCGP
jgi:hypothetical protein